MTERSEVEGMTRGRKVTFPEDGDERYMASVANVSLRRRGSFIPSQLADLEEAKKHQVRTTQRATRVAKIPKTDPASDPPRCKCCQYPLDSEVFQLTCSVDELGQLGSAFPLYYYFLKYLLIILSIATCISAVPCVIANVRAGRSAEYEKEDQGNQSSYVYLSLGNYGNPFNNSTDPSSEDFIPMWQALLHLVTMILILATYPFFKYYQSRKGIEIDLQSADSALYTVRVTGLGRDWDKRTVTDFFQQRGRWVKAIQDDKPAKVVSLTPVYHISEYLALCEELTKWETKYEFVRKYYGLTQRLPNERYLFCLRRMLYLGPMESEEVCYRRLQSAKSKVLNFESSSNIGKSTGTAFITFQTPLDARMVSRRFSSSLLEYLCLIVLGALGFKSRRKFNGRLLSAGMAPQPADIFWENLDVSKSRHLKLKLQTAGMAVVVLCVAFGVLVGLSYWKLKLSNDSDRSGQDSLALQLAPFLPSVFIMVINVVLATIMRKLASYEQHYSWTTYCKSVSEKLIIAEALNTSFLPFLVNLPPRDRWFMPGGLVDDIFLQIITMSILSPLQYLFNFSWAVKAYRRWRLAKTIPAGKSSLSQLACNRTFENTEIDVPERYVRLVNQLILAFVYAPAIPLGIPITLAGFAFEYIVDKYMLLRFHCRPKAQNSMLAEHLAKTVPITMGLYAVGAVVFYTVLEADRTYSCVIAMIVVAFCFFLFPVTTLFQGLMKAHPTDVVEELLSELPPSSYLYEKKAHTLLTDYKRENPITADKGFKEWLTLIIQHTESPTEAQLAQDLMLGSPDLTLQGSHYTEKMLNYNSRHQTLPETNEFLHGSNSDQKDELLHPARYTADRLERLRQVYAQAVPIKPLAPVQAPLDEPPEIIVPDEHAPPAEPAASAVFKVDHLPFYQSPYGNRSPNVLSPATIEQVSTPLLRRLTTVWMDVNTAPGALEDGELPALPISDVHNRRNKKIPYEPEHNDPYNFSIHERGQI